MDFDDSLFALLEDEEQEDTQDSAENDYRQQRSLHGQEEDEQDLNLSDGDDARSKALETMEGLVLDLLTQLSRSLPVVRDNAQTTAKGGELAGIALEVADRKRPRVDSVTPTRLVRFPQNKRRGNARSLATLFRVVELSHEGLLNGVCLSKRDMYYNDVALFQTQSVVNNLVDDLAATCGVARSDLNIAAACKGLWCGAGLSMLAKSGAVINGQCAEPVLIPAQDTVESIQLSEDTAWILVVEKDAVFQTLCRAGLATHPALPGPGIIITGKGYPDVATRDLVAVLSRSTDVPLLALVDCDSHGVDIFSCYKYGSKSMRHEQDRLEAPRLRWIGVLSSDLSSMNIEKDELLPLSAHDHMKAIALLKSSACAIEPLWRRELTHMLHIRRKAEVEVLASSRDWTPGTQDPLMEYVLDKIALHCKCMDGVEGFEALVM